MNEIELAQLFIDYKKAQETLAALEKSIQAAVLEIGESRSVAGVKATYYQPSIEYNYEAAARAFGVPDETVKEYSTVKYTPRWKEITDAIGASLDGFATEKPARVVVK